MNYVPNIYDILAQSTDITSRVDDRIYRTMAPQSKADGDYIVWSVISSVPRNLLACDAEICQERIQIDCYSLDEQRARELAIFIVTAMKASHYMLSGPRDMYEPDTRLYRWTADYRVSATS